MEMVLSMLLDQHFRVFFNKFFTIFSNPQNSNNTINRNRFTQFKMNFVMASPHNIETGVLLYFLCQKIVYREYCLYTVTIVRVDSSADL